MSDIIGEDYFIDPCEHLLLDSLDISKMVEWGFDGQAITLHRQQKTLSIAPSVL
jgi:hypothetical protein